MRLLVTGSAGFIGSALAPLLAAAGHQVAGADRRSGDGLGLERQVRGDLLDPSVLEDALDGPDPERNPGVDAVLHLAAAKDDWGLAPEEFHRDNIELTEKLVESGGRRGVESWIFLSTVAVIGPSSEAATEETPAEATDPYGGSKVAGERLFRELARQDPAVRVGVLRPSIVYGPGNYPYTNIYRLIEALHTGRFVMIGRGETLKTFSYVENLNAATVWLLEHLRPGVQTYICVDEPRLTTRHLVDRLCDLLGRRPPRAYLPRWIAEPLAWPADLAARWTGINFPITAARVRKFCTPTNYDPAALLAAGFDPPVDNDEALRRTVEWHLAERERLRGLPRKSDLPGHSDGHSDV